MRQLSFKTIASLLALSFVAGVVLEHFDITPQTMIADIGLTPDYDPTGLWPNLRHAIAQTVIGAIVVVPVWFVTRIFRSPR